MQKSIIVKNTTQHFSLSSIFVSILKKSSIFTQFSTVGQPLVTHIVMETLYWPFVLALHPLMELLGLFDKTVF